MANHLVNRSFKYHHLFFDSSIYHPSLTQSNFLEKFSSKLLSQGSIDWEHLPENMKNFSDRLATL